MKVSETTDGISYYNDSVLVFFGKKNCDLQRLQTMFPHFQFRGIKQTHSDLFIQSCENSGMTEADAHWTNQKGIALLIKTADCQPIMAFDKTAGLIAAIHAGWRGVANRITPNTLKTFSYFDLFIGPHILKNSFEVKEDAQNLLNASVPDCDPNQFTTTEKGSIKIDLQKIVLHQIGQQRVQNLYLVNKDTKTDLEFHSHRRDQINAGRNLSFICLLT